jgi:hypothetical protein
LGKKRGIIEPTEVDKLELSQKMDINMIRT